MLYSHSTTHFDLSQPYMEATSFIHECHYFIPPQPPPEISHRDFSGGDMALWVQWSHDDTGVPLGVCSQKKQPTQERFKHLTQKRTASASARAAFCGWWLGV
jgi:hypothetical protein